MNRDGDKYFGNFNVSRGITEIKYTRPSIIQQLRQPPKKAADRKFLMNDAADEIEELREFIAKQAELITRFMSELALND